MTALTAAFATVAFAALVVVAGYTATPTLLALAVGFTALVLALGWPRLLHLPSPRGTTLSVVLTGWSSAALAVHAVGITRPLAPFAALLALSVLLAFVHELLRRDGRSDLVESVTGTLAGQAVALLGGAWVMLPTTRLGLAALTVAAAATAAVRVIGVMPLTGPLAGWVSLAAGIIAGTFTAVMVGPTKVTALVVVAGIVSGVAAGLDLLLLHLTRSQGVAAALAGGAAPVLAVGTAAYAVARLLG
ncbi:MAG: hypothetical protein QG622_2450 [Actinomycetota bacterium]|nr:hypothetical protein [Actinomycetota bacterium]